MPATRSETIPWIVRPTTLDDGAAINDLFRQAWSTLTCYNTDVVSKALASFEDIRAQKLLTCGTYYAVFHPVTGAIVGAGGWTMEHPVDTGTSLPHIRHVATHPDFMHQGIATTIWKQCWEDITRQASSEAPPTVEVLSTLDAQPFYERLGFAFESEIIIPLGDTTDCPCAYMVRKP